jgi:hypothetical protein
MITASRSSVAFFPSLSSFVSRARRLAASARRSPREDRRRRETQECGLQVERFESRVALDGGGLVAPVTMPLPPGIVQVADLVAATFVPSHPVTAPAVIPVSQPDGTSVLPKGFYPGHIAGQDGVIGNLLTNGTAGPTYHGPCGPVSLVYTLDIYQDRADLAGLYDKLVPEAQAGRLLPGASPEVMRDVLESNLGMTVTLKGDASDQYIVDQLRQDRPVIALYGYWNSGQWKPTLHYVTVVGFVTRDGQLFFIVHDNGSFKEFPAKRWASNRNAPYAAGRVIHVNDTAGPMRPLPGNGEPLIVAPPSNVPVPPAAPGRPVVHSTSFPVSYR